MVPLPPGAAAVQVAGETLWLLPQRATFWPARRTLLVADLHLGKPAAFRAAALPVPEATMDADLDRLSNALRRTRAERLVILGDLLHARSGQTPRTVEAVNRWRERHRDLTVVLVLGNHDKRCGPTPDEWRMQIAQELKQEPPFIWCHWPDVHDAGYVVAGHVHPAAQLRGPGGQKERLRCFAVGEHRMILPAFGDFTGGAVGAPDPTDRVFVVADDQVVEVSSLGNQAST
jgi:DNA ligase-associated metallophosphoesterase